MKFSGGVAPAFHIETEQATKLVGVEGSPAPYSRLTLYTILIVDYGVMVLEARNLAVEQIDDLLRGGKVVCDRPRRIANKDQDAQPNEAGNLRNESPNRHRSTS
jgi:hypothetical protein